jgi:hypothetical protein
VFSQATRTHGHALAGSIGEGMTTPTRRETCSGPNGNSLDRGVERGVRRVGFEFMRLLCPRDETVRLATSGQLEARGRSNLNLNGPARETLGVACREQWDPERRAL